MTSTMLSVKISSRFLASQKLKIGELGFCSTIPSFSKDQSKVRAILSVDSAKKMDWSKDQKRIWEKHKKYYAAFIDKHTIY